MPDEPLDILVLDTRKGDDVMVAEERAAESMEAVIVTQAQGHAFCMEQGRLGMLEGKVGYREGLTHRIIGESAGGQSRAFLPAGIGGVPTTGVSQPS